MAASHEFSTLAVGAKFGPEADASKKLFRQSGTARSANANLVEQNAAGQAGPSTDIAALSVPPPAASLRLFGKRKQQAQEQPGDESKEAAKDEKQPIKQPGAGAVQRRLKALEISSTAYDFCPVKHFTELIRPPHRVPQLVVDNLFARDHKQPTPVQAVSIPLLLQGRDVLACAPTGSGKTVAFLVPLFARLRDPSRTAGVRALILAPTKELAMQLEREAFFLLKGNRWRLVQHGQTTRDKDIMVTTPARALQLHNDGKLALGAVQYIVFDEGDKLWEAGTDNFKAVDGLLAACTNADKVTCLFTATLSERVERLARTVMRDPVRLIVKGRAEASADVEHRLLFTGSEEGKITAMRNLIRDGIKPPILIFVQSIERTKELYDEIKGAGLHVAVLNSRMTSEERDETVLKFRMGSIWFLISTELLARGVDFKGVGTVINFDFPLTVESYVHRTGRTGRAGRRGTAITFFTEGDKERLPSIAGVIKASGSHVDPWILEKLEAVPARRLKQLERSVPHRAVVSTRKRMQIGTKRVEAGLRAAEREAREKDDAGKKKKKNRAEGDDYDDDEEEFAMDGYEEVDSVDIGDE